ncbi:MAG: plasmid mobilization protein [Clostridia bacterium]
MRERDIKKIFYFNEKENKRLKKNVLKSNLSGSSYLRSLITNYQPKYAHSDTILLPIINELKSVGKTLNEIARTANRFDFINTRYCNRVIERIDVMSDNIREKVIITK